MLEVGMVQLTLVAQSTGGFNGVIGFRLRAKVLVPLILASASSSDSERAGSTTQLIIGSRARQMGHET